jgi:glycosyltransferase involved in cell wall biosynthesis
MNAVIHITDASAAGVLHVLVGYANGQVREGAEVTVLYVAREETPEDLRSYFDPRVELREVKGRTRLSALWRAAGFARRALREDPRVVVHAHSTRAGMAVRARAIVVGFAQDVVYSPHGFGFLREDLPKPVRTVLKGVERVLARGCRKLILVSPSEARVGRALASSDKLAVVPNSVRIDAAAHARTLAEPGATPCVVTTGRITAQKAPERIAALSRAFSGAARFVWVGDGDIEAKAELERSGVAVTGWLDEDDVVRRLAEADVFVLLSRWEGMPLALLEAQAMGLPSVASDVVGNTDVVVDGATGFLVANGAEARAALSRLVSSADLRTRLGENARVNARRYTPAVTLAALAAAYSREVAPL